MNNTPLTEKQLIELAMEAHITCCPYMTDQIGEPCGPFSDIAARCGAGKLYCGSCWYIDSFQRVLKKLLKDAKSGSPQEPAAKNLQG